MPTSLVFLHRFIHIIKKLKVVRKVVRLNINALLTLFELYLILIECQSLLTAFPFLLFFILLTILVSLLIIIPFHFSILFLVIQFSLYLVDELILT